MSGGPVVNQAGHVVGLVSTGVAFAASGSAVYLSGSGMAEGAFPQIDPGAPGQIFCWAGFDAGERLVAVAPTREALASMPGAPAFAEVHWTSYDASNGNYMCVDPPPGHVC